MVLMDQRAKSRNKAGKTGRIKQGQSRKRQVALMKLIFVEDTIMFLTIGQHIFYIYSF
jgi:hypothetical protein